MVSLCQYTALWGLFSFLHWLLTRRRCTRTPALLQLGLAPLDLVAQAGGKAVAAAAHLSRAVGRTPSPPGPSPTLLLHWPLSAEYWASPLAIRPTGLLQLRAAAAGQWAAARLWAVRGILSSPCGSPSAALRMQRGQGPVLPTGGWRGSPTVGAQLERAELGSQQLLGSTVTVRHVALERGQQWVVTCCCGIRHLVHAVIHVWLVVRLHALPQEWLSWGTVWVGAHHVILVSRETLLCGVWRQFPPAHYFCLPIPLAEEGVGDPPGLGMQHIC